MVIQNISQKASSFLHHKTFHPTNNKNLEQISAAEQTERKKKEKYAQRQRLESQNLKFVLANETKPNAALDWNSEHASSLIFENQTNNETDIQNEQNEVSIESLQNTGKSKSKYARRQDLKLQFLHDPLFKIRCSESLKKSSTATSKAPRSDHTSSVEKKKKKSQADKLALLEKLRSM